MSVVKAPAWAAPSRPGALPEDTRAFGRTMRYLAARYQGRVQAWEIWNEQNLAGEVGGRVDVAPYFETLKAGYGAVKAVDPGAVVLFGGLTPTGLMDPAVAIDDTAYLQAFYAYAGGEGKQYFDALAAHPCGSSTPTARRPASTSTSSPSTRSARPIRPRRSIPTSPAPAPARRATPRSRAPATATRAPTTSAASRTSTRSSSASATARSRSG